jgi:hypothetical protein
MSEAKEEILKRSLLINFITNETAILRPRSNNRFCKFSFTMTKVQTFDVTNIMFRISDFAPFVLMVLAFLSFFAVGVFWHDYYTTLLESRFTSSAPAMAVLISIIQEAVRFGLLVASMKDFTDSKPYNGWLGLAGSIGLVWHDASVCKEVAKVWNAENPEPYAALIMFLIIVGLVLELRLILTMSGRKEAIQQKQFKDYVPNGNGKSYV